ncbi:hypothetical protein J2X36_003681 [Methylobacterium sp. BE186]|uniref:hypothetical protein n=1 Tax=Methylobacterium sp. BE186 TaxID=2817715 RepID=UPI002863CD1A|nr:hypothetical protein [Methylobacterium sp. BE186]MDR7038909.1 hypothetical protein [Methylobacterium sp. BE186]
MRAMVRALLSAGLLAAGAAPLATARAEDAAALKDAAAPKDPAALGAAPERSPARDETVTEILERLRKETGVGLKAAPEPASTEVTIQAYRTRAQRKLDEDERAWKRITASICSGCGASAPGRAVPVTPGEVLARTAPAARTAETAENAGPVTGDPVRTTEARAPRLRYARLRRQLLGQPRAPVARSRLATEQAAAAGRRKAAYAVRRHLRYAAYRRHLLRQARAAAEIRRRARYARLGRVLRPVGRARDRLALSRRPVERRQLLASLGGGGAGDRRSSLPRPVRSHDALCTYGYGPFVPTGGYPSVCVTGR